MISEHLDKNNLHHAYLIEGASEEIAPEIFEFIKTFGIKGVNDPDLYHMNYDSFKIEDARNLKSIENEKSFNTGKKIFLISANNFLLEAQNTLLKIFEEPIENTHFFIIVPSINNLLKTFVSRFYLIQTKIDVKSELAMAEKFLSSEIPDRIEMIKELLIEKEEEEEVTSLDSNRPRALKFLNTLETILQHRGTLCNYTGFPCAVFNHIFKVREFINQPGSSIKSLMESVALILPNS